MRRPGAVTSTVTIIMATPTTTITTTTTVGPGPGPDPCVFFLSSIILTDYSSITINSSNFGGGKAGGMGLGLFLFKAWWLVGEQRLEQLQRNEPRACRWNEHMHKDLN
jgi:hypothetical protein